MKKKMRIREIVLKKMLEDQGWRVFDIDEKDGCEIERWTNGGVDVILYIQPFTIEEYKDVVNCIDCSEEVVLLWNNDPTYKQALEQSVMLTKITRVSKMK